MSGFLVTVVRAFDNEPLGLFATEGEAVEAAKGVIASAGDRAERDARSESARPKRGKGCLGPPGLLSYFVGVVMLPFVDGRPDPENARRFVPGD